MYGYLQKVKMNVSNATRNRPKVIEIAEFCIIQSMIKLSG